MGATLRVGRRQEQRWGSSEREARRWGQLPQQTHVKKHGHEGKRGVRWCLVGTMGKEEGLFCKMKT